MGQLTTILLRGSTANNLDGIEHAIDDGVNAYRVLCKDARMVPAGGATEIAIAKKLTDLARQQDHLEQYTIQKFADAFEVIPRTLAENSGLNSTDVVSSIWSTHVSGDMTVGIDIESGTIKDLSREDIVDLFTTKWWAFKLLCDAVIAVLKVDQVIMAKQAGGSKSRAEVGDNRNKNL